jgi:hypothetical protein
MPDETPTVSQMDLDYVIEKPDWVALKILIEEIEDELGRSRNNLLFCLSNWFLAVTIFKKFEERQMVLSNPTARDRDYHRVILTGLLANGEKVLHELTRHQEIDSKNVGIDLKDVQASVNELRLSYAEWFSDIKDERKGAVLREVFGGEE